MDQFTLVSTSAGEQNITPGEQRILALMEQGHQRIEQRMDSMEQRMGKRMERIEQRLEDLTAKVDHEIGASKMRDRQLAIDIQGLREEIQHRELLLKTHIDNLENSLRKDFGERFEQLDTRLGVVELLVQQGRRA
jgi:predicted metal-dependent hydrolase